MAGRSEAKQAHPTYDEIRLNILRLLYDERVATAARRRYNWSDLRMKVRNALGFSPSETTHNLLYLIQNGWIEKEAEPYSGLKSRAYGTRKELHSISAKAIDLFEEGSMFSEPASLYGLAVAGDHNVIQVGTNIYAHQSYQDLQTALIPLFQAVVLSEDLTPEQKFEAIADIKAIQSQLLKAEPNKPVLNKLKENLHWLGDVAGLSSFLMSVLQHWPF